MAILGAKPTLQLTRIQSIQVNLEGHNSSLSLKLLVCVTFLVFGLTACSGMIGGGNGTTTTKEDFIIPEPEGILEVTCSSMQGECVGEDDVNPEDLSFFKGNVF